MKEFKAIAAEWDEQRKKAIADEEWHSLLDCTQCFFRASFIPVRLDYLLQNMLAI